MQKIIWTGPPLLYTSPVGQGLIIGRYRYVFAGDGALKESGPVPQDLLVEAVSTQYRKPGLAMAAYAKKLSVPKKENVVP